MALTEQTDPPAADVDQPQSPAAPSPQRDWGRLVGVLAYTLMFGFWAVAAGLSAQGLIGFGFDNMELEKPWPYLLFAALDGAAGMCMVLLMRRAARNEGAAVLRATVWGLVAASSWFNWEHAPDNPGAHFAFALFPVVGGLLFEFAIKEIRHQAADASRRMQIIRWLHPIERIRVQAELGADESLSAQQATHRVRVGRAAHHLYRLRRREAGDPGWKWVTRRTERRAQAALSRAGFADEQVAREVLRALQVLAQAPTLAALDLATPDAALDVLGNLIDDGQDHEDTVAPDGPDAVPGEATGELPLLPPGLVGVDLEDRTALLVLDGQFHHSTCVLVLGTPAGPFVWGAGSGLSRGLQPCSFCFPEPDPDRPWPIPGRRAPSAQPDETRFEGDATRRAGDATRSETHARWDATGRLEDATPGAERTPAGHPEGVADGRHTAAADVHETPWDASAAADVSSDDALQRLQRTVQRGHLARSDDPARGGADLGDGRALADGRPAEPGRQDDADARAEGDIYTSADLAELGSDAARVRVAIEVLGVEAASQDVTDWLLERGVEIPASTLRSAVHRAKTAIAKELSDRGTLLTFERPSAR